MERDEKTIRGVRVRSISSISSNSISSRRGWSDGWRRRMCWSDWTRKRRGGGDREGGVREERKGWKTRI